jgi:hypothetical protein
MRFIENEKSGVESQTFGRQRVKIQAAATIAYGGLLFPPERGEMDHLSARASGNRQRLPGIRLNAEETGAGLDFFDQASVVIAHVIDSATDRSRN